MRLRRAAAGAVLALAAGCGGSGGPADDPYARPPASTDPYVAAVGDYLREVRAEVVSVNLDAGHLGIYVKPDPAWDLDRYVTQLPLAAESARAVLARFPELADVDICADGPWLPHPSGAAFASAVRVQVFRDRAARLPAVFREPADVLRAGLRDRSLDYYLDPRILTESAAYAAARKAA